jgi:hypothetical protein
MFCSKCIVIIWRMMVPNHLVKASLAQVVVLVNGLSSLAYLIVCFSDGNIFFCSPNLDILDSSCASFIVLRISLWWPLSWRAWWRFVHPLSWSECRSCFVTLIFLFHGSLHDAWAMFPLCKVDEIHVSLFSPCEFISGLSSLTFESFSYRS